MNTLLILYSTIRELTTNSTNYYQLTQLLCGQNKTTILTPNNYFLVHYIPLKYFTPFFKTTIILLSNCYFGNRRGLMDHIQTKNDFWVVTTHVFFQRFYSLMKLFFLNWLEQRDTDSLILIATIPLLYSLFGVGYVSLRVCNGCVYNLWNVTQESYSVRVQVLGNHCAQGVFCR